jgi:hypothetical protein
LDEFRGAALHLLLAVANIKTEPSTTVLATDATPTCGGATEAKVDPVLAKALYRVAEARGVSARLDGRRAEEESTYLLQKSEITDN